MAEVNTCGSPVNTKLAVYLGSGCPSDGSALDCSLDDCSYSDSAVQFPAFSGVTYLVQLGTASAGTGGSGLLNCGPMPVTPCPQLHDGTSESSGGIINGGELGILYYVDCLSTINSIEVAFGSAARPGTLAAGRPVTLAIWDDPTNDVDPTDAVLIKTIAVPGGVINPCTDIINSYPTGGVPVSGGTWIGAVVTSESGEYPGPLDWDACQFRPDRSWAAIGLGGSFDFVDLSANWLIGGNSSGYIQGNWLLHPTGAANRIPDQEQLDIDSPVFSDNSLFVFQQQVRAGISGRLEGFDIYADTHDTAQTDLRIRLGDGWNTGPVVWSGAHVGPSSNYSPTFIDVSGANIQLLAGETFVIEYQGTDTWSFIFGNAPSSTGISCYPEPFFVNGQMYDHCFGFRTYMTPDYLRAYCAGDGGGTPCPCSNDNDGSMPIAGCANGAFASGAVLVANGLASVTNDSLVLATYFLEAGDSGLYFQADNDLSPGFVWGDGLRCAGGNLKRLQVRFADSSGTSATTVGISAKAGNVSAGDVKRYQCWYRTTQNPPCGPGVNDFNASNGYEISWLP